MHEAIIIGSPADRFAELLSPQGFEDFTDALGLARTALAGRTLWNLNSTLTGGGVAELLGDMLPYLADAGVNVRWLAIDTPPEFLEITKRLHHRLHGFEGDAGTLDERNKAVYLQVMKANAAQMLAKVAPRDVVIVHDPQPAGLIPMLKSAGAQVIWQCHIGTGVNNQMTRQAQEYLLGDVQQADAYVFTRAEYAWDGLDPSKVHVITPSTNPFSPKNYELDAHEVLQRFGFYDGTPRESNVEFIAGGPVPRGVPVVLQVSRWDKLKDPAGVMDMFDRHLSKMDADAHLVLAGPQADGVTDDPEGAAVAKECISRYREMGCQERMHLVSLPMDDPRENELIVNALQRNASVVLQKSLAEGFGLVVAEAMWKSRPVVASAVGGIQDQIESGVSGILIGDPRDLAACAAAIVDLLNRPERAAAMGKLARQRVCERFLTCHQLIRTSRLIAKVA